MPGSVSQPRFVLIVYHSYFFLPPVDFRGMILASPPHHSSCALSLSVSILFVPFITISIVALVQLDPKVGKCHMWFCAIVWHLVDSVEDYLHMWMDRSLCVSYCACVRARAYVFVCVCDFLSFHVDWHLPHPSISLFSPLFSLPPSRPPLYDVYWTWRAANLF